MLLIVVLVMLTVVGVVARHSSAWNARIPEMLAQPPPTPSLSAGDGRLARRATASSFYRYWGYSEAINGGFPSY